MSGLRLPTLHPTPPLYGRYVWDLSSPSSCRAPLNALQTPHLDENHEFVEGRWAADGATVGLCDVSGRLVLYGAALGAAAATALRDEPVAGGATVLASCDEHPASAAPHEQYFESDTLPLGPFEPTDPPGGRTAAPLWLSAPPNTLLLDRAKTPHADSVQAAAAAAAAAPCRPLSPAEVETLRAAGAERAHAEAAKLDEPPLERSPGARGKQPANEQRKRCAPQARAGALFGMSCASRRDGVGGSTSAGAAGSSLGGWRGHAHTLGELEPDEDDEVCDHARTHTHARTRTHKHARTSTHKHAHARTRARAHTDMDMDKHAHARAHARPRARICSTSTPHPRARTHTCCRTTMAEPTATTTATMTTALWWSRS
jgi:hypothetical protein